MGVGRELGRDNETESEGEEGEEGEEGGRVQN